MPQTVRVDAGRNQDTIIEAGQMEIAETAALHALDPDCVGPENGEPVTRADRELIFHRTGKVVSLDDEEVGAAIGRSKVRRLRRGEQVTLEMQ